MSLILSRQRGEDIEVQTSDGTTIGTVGVDRIRGDKVRLRLDFPKEYKLHRREVADKIRHDAETKAAK